MLRLSVNGMVTKCYTDHELEPFYTNKGKKRKIEKAFNILEKTLPNDLLEKIMEVYNKSLEEQ